MPSHSEEGHPVLGASSGAAVLLVGADGGAGGVRALHAAARLAQRLGARVVVGHAQPLPVALAPAEFGQALRDDLEFEVVTQASAALDPAGVQWTLALVDGDPAHGLHRLADQHDAAVIVVGARGCGAGPALHRIANGSVSSHLAHHERRPVLVVPA